MPTNKDQLDAIRRQADAAMVQAEATKLQAEKMADLALSNNEQLSELRKQVAAFEKFANATHRQAELELTKFETEMADSLKADLRLSYSTVQLRGWLSLGQLTIENVGRHDATDVEILDITEPEGEQARAPISVPREGGLKQFTNWPRRPSHRVRWTDGRTGTQEADLLVSGTLQ